MARNWEKVLRKSEMYKEMETSAEMINLAVQSSPPMHLGMLPVAQSHRNGQLAAKVSRVFLETQSSASLPLCLSASSLAAHLLSIASHFPMLV